EAVTRPCYRLYDLGAHPALVADANGVAVRGELWALDGATLRELGEYEGAPGEFVRRPAALEPRTPARPSPAEPHGLGADVAGGPAAGCALVAAGAGPAPDGGACWPGGGGENAGRSSRGWRCTPGTVCIMCAPR